MGRRKDPVWRHFTEVPPADGANQRVPRMKCNYCEYNQAFNSTRANRHIYDVCANVPPPPQDVNREMRPEPAELEIAIDEAGRPVERPVVDQPEANENEQKNAENAEPRPSRVQQVGRFFDSMSESERTKLDAMFARAVFATGTAFFTHDNYYWREFFKALRPAWKQPLRNKVSTTLLDSEYNRVCEIMFQRIITGDRPATVVQDGWTNVLGHNTMLTMVTNRLLTSFHSIALKGRERADAQNLARNAIEVFNQLEPDPEHATAMNRKFTGYMKDNEPKMRSCGRLVAASLPGVVPVGYTAHLLDLIMKHLKTDCEELKTHLDLCQHIVRKVKNSPLTYELAALLERDRAAAAAANLEVKNVTLKLAVATRFYTYDTTVESLLNNERRLRELATMPDVLEHFPDDMRAEIVGQEFWSFLRQFRVFSSVHRNVIDTVQSQRASITLIPAVFNTLTTVLDQIDDDVSWKDQAILLTERYLRKATIEQPCVCAALLLHPGKQSEEDRRRVRNDLLRIGREWIMNYLGPGEDGSRPATVMAQFNRFRAKAGVFESPLLWEPNVTSQPYVWWKSTGSHMPELQRVAMVVLSLPASSADVERVASAVGFIHDDRRNSLAPARVEKLTAVMWNLRHMND
eukprot:221381_1